MFNMFKVKEINVAMIGASGVGKTTLLTSMYNEFNNNLSNENNLQLMADDNTQKRLDKKLGFLTSQINDNTIVMAQNLEGTQEVEEFNFILAKDLNDNAKIKINFKDFPGGYIHDNKNEVRDIIEESDIIMIPIDTAALMEQKGKYNELINNISTITSLLKNQKSNFEI